MACGLPGLAGSGRELTFRGATDSLLRMARGPGGMTLGTTIAAQAFTLVTGIIAARTLGVEGRGTLALLWLIPVILSLLGGIGIPQASTYYVARNLTHARAIIRKAAGITALAALGSVLIYSLGLLIFKDGNHEISTLDAALSVSLLPFLFAQNLAIGSLLGQQRFLAYNAARLIPVLTYAALSVVLVAIGQATLTSILAAALAGWVAAAAIAWFQIARTAPDQPGKAPVSSGQIANFGIRGVIGSVSPIDDVRLDQFLVGVMLDARALGLYVAAVAFCNFPRFVALSIGSVSYPRIAAEKRGAAAWGMTVRYFRIGLVAIAAFSAGIFLLLPLLLPLFFGGDFEDAVGLGRILMVGAFFLALHRLMTEIARGLGHPGYGSITEALNAVVFLLVLFVVLGAGNEREFAWAVVAGGLACSTLLGLLIYRLRAPLLAGKPNQAGPLRPE